MPLFVGLSVLLPLIAFHVTRAVLKPRFPEFTAKVHEVRSDARGHLRLSAIYIHGQRSDGTTVDLYARWMGGRWAFLGAQQVDLATTTRRTVNLVRGSVTATSLSEQEMQAAKRRKSACTSYGTEKGTLLRRKVHRVAMFSGTLLVKEDWAAPELSCYALVSTVFDRQGIRSRRQMSFVVELAPGSPDSAYFSLSPDVLRQLEPAAPLRRAHVFRW